MAICGLVLITIVHVYPHYRYRDRTSGSPTLVDADLPARVHALNVLDLPLSGLVYVLWIRAMPGRVVACF